MAENEFRAESIESLAKRFVDQSFNGDVDKSLAEQVSIMMSQEFSKHQPPDTIELSFDRSYYLATKSFEDGAHGMLTLDVESTDPLRMSNWSYTLTLANGVLLRETENKFNSGMENHIVVNDQERESISFSTNLCVPAAGHEPVLKLTSDVDEVSRISDGVLERLGLGESNRASIFTDCDLIPNEK